MKKKFLIISASISLLLVCFPFTLCAEDAPASDPGSPPASLTPGLDSYFWENYDLLPYIESDGSQYIDTGIKPTEDLYFYMTFGGFDITQVDSNSYIFGSSSSNNSYQSYVEATNDRLVFHFMGSWYTYSTIISNEYSIHNMRLYETNLYLDNQLVSGDVDLTGLTNNNNIYIFNRNPINTGLPYKLYFLSLFDASEQEYVRYYYPAQAKSGGTIGLYDAVSKTFVTTSGNTPFTHPDGSEPIHFDVGVFIVSGLGWIGDILDYAISEPVILLFMAIGLAGASIRWARRLVHF